MAEKSKRFLTRSGIPLKEIYWPKDASSKLAEDPHEFLGEPAQFPYTRGVQKDMYRGRLWTMRQYAGFGTAEESNRRYHYLLSQGTTGLSVVLSIICLTSLWECETVII